MLTDDEQRTLEQVCNAPFGTAIEHASIIRLATLGYVEAYQTVWGIWCKAKPEGRDKLNRLLAKAKESEVGDE